VTAKPAKTYDKRHLHPLDRDRSLGASDIYIVIAASRSPRIVSVTGGRSKSAAGKSARIEEEEEKSQRDAKEEGRVPTQMYSLLRSCSVISMQRRRFGFQIAARVHLPNFCGSSISDLVRIDTVANDGRERRCIDGGKEKEKDELCRMHNSSISSRPESRR